MNIIAQRIWDWLHKQWSKGSTFKEHGRQVEFEGGLIVIRVNYNHRPAYIFRFTDERSEVRGLTVINTVQVIDLPVLNPKQICNAIESALGSTTVGAFGEFVYQMETGDIFSGVIHRHSSGFMATILFAPSEKNSLTAEINFSEQDLQLLLRLLSEA